MVGEVIGHDGLVGTLAAQLASVLVVVGVAVGLYLAQGEASVRSGGDGERYGDVLAVGLCRAGVCRYILVVDIDGALDVPVVCRRGIVAAIAAYGGEAVVNNLAVVVYEVAGGLCLLQIAEVCEAPPGACRGVVGREGGQLPFGVPRLGVVFVLRVDVAAAHALHDVEQVELDDAGDVAPLGVAALLAGFAYQFEVYARGECHLVGRRAVVAALLGLVGYFERFPRRGAIAFEAFLGRCAHIDHLHVAGQVAEVVHHAVDAEVIAVDGIFCIGVAGGGWLLVQRQLAHAVDGVLGVVGLLGHTVKGTLQHQSATEDAHEVGPLDGVQQSAGPDGAEALLHPVGVVGILRSRAGEQLFVVLFRQLVANTIALAFFVGTRLLADEPQLEVGTLSVVQCFVLLEGDVVGHVVVVGAVVGDVQSAVSVDEGQVAVAVESAGVLGAYGDEVTVVEVAHGCDGVAEHRLSVDVHLIAARRGVAAGEDGVVYDDAVVVQAAPLAGRCALVVQGVEVFHRHIVAGGISFAVDGDGRGDSTVGSHVDIDIERHAVVDIVVDIVVAAAVFRQTVGIVNGVGVGAFLAGVVAVDISHVSATEDVAVALCHAGIGAHHAAAYAHAGGAEDVALRREVYAYEQMRELLLIDLRAVAAPVVEAATASEDVAHDVASVERDLGAAALVYLCHIVHPGASGGAVGGHGASAYGAYLATAVEAAAHVAAIHCHLRGIGIAVGHVAAAEDVAAVVEATEVVICQYLFVALVEAGGQAVVGAEGVVAVAHVAVVHGDACRAPDGTALAAAVDVALDGGYAVGEAGAAKASHHDVGHAEYVGSVVVGAGDGAAVVAHAALPAATVDVAGCAAAYVDVGAGCEAVGVGAGVVDAHAEGIAHVALGARAIDVFLHGAAEQGEVGCARDEGLGTLAAAIGIVFDGGSLVDDDVGVVAAIRHPAVGGVHGRVVGVGQLSPAHDAGVCRIEEVGMVVGGVVRAGKVFGGYVVVAQLPRVVGYAQRCGVQLAVLLHAGSIEHLSVLSAAVDLVDRGTAVQVHLSIFCPAVLAVAGAVDGGKAAGVPLRLYWGVDIDMGVDGASLTAVATEDGAHLGRGAAPVDVRLVDVARLEGAVAVGSAVDVVHFGGRGGRHVDHRAACDSLLVAAAICFLYLSAEEVDDGRSEVGVARFHRFRLDVHAQAALCAGPEDPGLCEVGVVLRNVYQYVSALLHLVHVGVEAFLGGMSLSAAVYLLHAVQLVAALAGLEVDEGVAQLWLVVARSCVAGLLATGYVGGTGGIEVLAVGSVAVVVVAVASAEDVLHVAFDVLHVGRGCGGGRRWGGAVVAVHGGAYVGAHTAEEVAVGPVGSQVCLAEYASAQVVGAVEVVEEVGEAVLSDVRLGVSVDVGVARAGEAVEQPSVVQVEHGVAGDGSFESSAVDEDGLCHVVVGGGLGAVDIVHVDVGAVAWVVADGRAVDFAAGIAVVAADESCLSSAEYLEGEAAVQVDRGTAPHLGVLAVAAAEHVEGCAQRVHALLGHQHA